MRTIHAVVTGIVQGVGFRYTTQRAASRLGLAGWVRNRPDGSVELVAQGDDEAVAELIAFIEQGPRGARVSSVRLEDIPADPGLTGFEVRF